MAEKKVKVKIDVETNTAASIASLKELKKQLRETAAGSDEFKKISRNIKDVEDSLEESRAGAKGFVDMLEEAPGPLGALFKGIRSAEIATKGFGMAWKAAGIGLIVSVIGSLVAAFNNVEGAQKKLQPILIAFEKILGGIFRALEPMIDAFLDLAIKALPFVTKGIGIFYSALVGLFTYIKEAGTGVAKVWKAIFTLDTDLALEGINQIKNSFATAAEAGTEAYKRFEGGTQELTKTEKEENEKRQKLADDEAAKRQSAADKAKAAADKAKAAKEKAEQEEERKREEQRAKLEAANAAELEAFKETLSEQERAEYEAGLKRNERIAALEAAGKKDFTLIEQAYQKELAEIRQKAADEEAEKKKEADEKERERLKKKADDERALILFGLQNQLDALDRANKAIEGDFEADLARIAEQRLILDQQEAAELANEELTQLQRLEIQKKYSALRRGLTDQELATEKASLEARKALNLQYADLFGQLGAFLQQAAGKNKALQIAGLVIEQAAAVARIIVNTQAAAAKAGYLTPVGIATLAAGALGVASAVIATKRGIDQINKQQIPGGGGGGGAAGGGLNTGAASALQAPRVGGINAPQIQGGGEGNPSQRIGETLAAATQRPIQTFVVSSAVSSAQALDRRTNAAATFSGG